MHFMRENGQGILLEKAFSLLPEPVMTFAEAYQHLVKGRVEQVPVAEMGGRIVATGVVPYPPGIPLLLPGERAGGAWTNRYSSTCWHCRISIARFPGFSHDTHGVECVNGEYRIFCIKEDP